jgi:transcriptional regulator with XRE-family HTH domain
MSIVKSTNKTVKPNRIHNALALASMVRRRRQNLGMSVERAADLSGLQVSEWRALETGWAPDKFCVLSAVAQTLDVGYLRLSFLAEVSRYNQIKPV